MKEIVYYLIIWYVSGSPVDISGPYYSHDLCDKAKTKIVDRVLANPTYDPEINGISVACQPVKE